MWWIPGYLHPISNKRLRSSLTLRNRAFLEGFKLPLSKVFVVSKKPSIADQLAILGLMPVIKYQISLKLENQRCLEKSSHKGPQKLLMKRYALFHPGAPIKHCPSPQICSPHNDAKVVFSKWPVQGNDISLPSGDPTNKRGPYHLSSPKQKPPTTGKYIARPGAFLGDEMWVHTPVN